MVCIGVIPVRMTSTRLPGKPLKDIAGRSLVQRVWERACKARELSRVIVTTDDQQIFQHAKDFGAEVILTRADHLTGSDRVAEVVHILSSHGECPELVANVQGDMPFINPMLIDQTVRVLADAPSEVGMSTVAVPILSLDDFQKPSVVKVVVGSEGRALYFSRSPIPHWREPMEQTPSEANPLGFKHMGLYVFRPEVLMQITRWPVAPVEACEKLEQLRALSNGVQIRVATAALNLVNPSIEVDTPEDLAHAIIVARREGL